MNNSRLSSLVYLAYIIPIVLIAGVAGAVAAALIGLALDAMESVVQLLPRARFLLPCIGAFIVGSLILRFAPGAGGEGVPLYIIAVNRDEGRSKLSDALLKIPATILTLGTYGSGGIIGPLMRIGSGISGFLADKLLTRFVTLRNTGRRTAAICGASAAIGAVLHTPLAAGIFAAEVLRRENLRYGDLFPSILAGIAGTLSSVYIFHQEALLSIDAPRAEMTAAFLPWLVLTAIASGMFGMVFLLVFESIARALATIPGRQPARALAGSLAIAAIYYLMGSSALGASVPLLREIVRGNVVPAAAAGSTIGSASLVIALLIATKIVATSLTVGSGMSGGFTGPLLLLGIAAGALMSRAAGTSPGDPMYYDGSLRPHLRDPGRNRRYTILPPVQDAFHLRRHRFPLYVRS
jgi:CIC family chloride channel protein